MTRNEVISEIRKIYPKHNKQAFSLASRPDETGVRFTKVAEDIVNAFSCNAAGRSVEHRKKPNRIYCRLTESDFYRVKRSLTANGWKSWQGLIEHLLLTYAENEKSAPPSAKDETQRE